MQQSVKPHSNRDAAFAKATLFSGWNRQAPGNLQTLPQVLVAEDQYVIARDLSVTLERSGVRVLGPVATLEAALSLLRRHDDIAGAVLDVSLQGTAVWPLAEALRRRRVPFVFFTAHRAAAIAAAFRDTVVCEKPLPARGVVRALQGEMARLLQVPLSA
jgi:CheY-like chemotaxis protein